MRSKRRYDRAVVITWAAIAACLALFWGSFALYALTRF